MTTKRNGLLCYEWFQKLIEARAYAKWVAGSTDTVRNWYEAELEVLNEMSSKRNGETSL